MSEAHVIIYPTCICGKKTYRSRKEARRTARTLYRGSRLQTYYCDRGAVAGWHFGHAIGYERGADARREGRSA